MIRRKSLPTQSEIKISLGDELANVVIGMSHEEISKILRMPSTLGSRKKILMSPSEQLLESNYLKTNHTDFIKACTHNEILRIGEQVLEKYRQDTERRMKAKFFQDLVKEKNFNEAEKRRAIELASKKIREQYKKWNLELKSRFEGELEAEIERTMNDCKLKMKEAILEERANISRETMEKMRDEIRFSVNSLRHDFEQRQIAEKQNLLIEFNEIIRRERLKNDAEIKDMIKQKEEEFRIKSHEFELQKIADLTYILCSERMRCNSEKHEIHQNFEKQIEAVQKMLVEANQVIELLREKPAESENENPSENENENHKNCELKIIEIVKQFQKFINFAFGAVPGQTEFLLSLESLLTFELDKKITKNEKIQLIPDIRQPCSAKDELTNNENRGIERNLKKELFRAMESLNSISSCNFQKTLCLCDTEKETEKETNTVTELAEDTPFSMELGSTKTFNLKDQTKQKKVQCFQNNDRQIKQELSRENLLKKIKAHNQMIKSVTPVKENGKEIFRVVEDNGVEHHQTFEEFTISRMQSLKRIFNLHPSLQHILIPHIGKIN